MKQYFKKELVSTGLRDSKGVSIPFEKTETNTGVIALNDKDDADLIADLEKIAGSRGVVKITEKDYDEFKKKSDSKKPNDKLSGPRIFAPEETTAWNPFKVEITPSVQDVPVSANQPAAEEPPVPPAKVQGKFKPRAGKPKSKK